MGTGITSAPMVFPTVCLTQGYVHLVTCGVGSLGTGVTDSCEQPLGCWDLNLGPLEEQVFYYSNRRETKMDL
ncbi:hypothetical protein STEG23_000925, partial [Scotinomys teguina]